MVVDVDAVGSVDQPGYGAKILYGDGALDQYLSHIKVNLTKSCDLGILYFFATWCSKITLDLYHLLPKP